MHDVIIIGAGPAGLTAGIYLARAGLKTLILEKETIGGNIASSPLVENYPGFTQISGSELADQLFEQVTSLNVDVEIETVIKIIDGNIKKVICENKEYPCKAIIVATGSKYRKLNIEKEVDFIGKGIHFCTLCDGAFYKDKIVAVIGGANTAITNALYLSDLCKKVYVIYRGDKLRCEKQLSDKLNKKNNIEVIYNANVISLKGDENLTGITIKISDEKKDIELDAIFESIGMIPATDIIELPLDNQNYFDSLDCKTKKQGIFVAGDCRSKAIRQITTATSDGTIAAIEVIEYLRHLVICQEKI